MKSAVLVKTQENFQNTIAEGKIVVEVFDIAKAKQMINDMINELNNFFPTNGAHLWIEKNLPRFTHKATIIDSAMAAAIASGNMNELKKQMRDYYYMHTNAFAAFNSYKDSINNESEGGLSKEV